MNRFAVFDRQDGPLFDLDDNLWQATRTEAVNGEHKLDIVTTQTLEEGMRILSRDGTGKWREWVVDEPDELHDGTTRLVGTYGCTWSMQYDLAGVSGGELWPGTYEPITAESALSMVLAATGRWQVGKVSLVTSAGTSLYDGSVWDYLGQLIEVWGGEIEPRIEVDSDGVVSRYVDWHAHMGNTEATRRFDYGEDCTSIRRKPDPGPRYCRVVPRGGSDATDADGVSYSDRVGIEEETGGIPYIQDDEAALLFRRPDGKGGWEYPTKVVLYDLETEGDAEELLIKAQEDLYEHTRPKVTYEASVLQFVAAGMDAKGVQLGDEVQIVDRKFGDTPLRLQARVVEMAVNELDETDAQLTIGEAGKGIEASFGSMQSAIDSVNARASRIEGGGSSSIVYLQNLVDQLNAEINATGGYSYIVPGEGLLTYDKAVSDPAVGTEATQVVQIKGGSIRIANSRTSSGDWDWKSVFVSGSINTEMITALDVCAGIIHNSDNTSVWYLDSGKKIVDFGAYQRYNGRGISATNATDAEAVLLENPSSGKWGFIDKGYVDSSAANQSLLGGFQLTSMWNDWSADPKITYDGVISTSMVQRFISGNACGEVAYLRPIDLDRDESSLHNGIGLYEGHYNAQDSTQLFAVRQNGGQTIEILIKGQVVASFWHSQNNISDWTFTVYKNSTTTYKS